MRVLKFGGTSVATAERIAAAAAIVAAAAEEDKVLVVSSALAGVTDRLAELAHRARAGGGGWHEEVAEISDRHLNVAAELSRSHGKAVALIEKRLDELRGLLTGVTMIGECPPRVHDRILATGERLAVPLVALALETNGISAEVIDGSEVVVATADGRVDMEATRARLDHHLKGLPYGSVAVVTGFVAADHDARTTTLGRGGSDLSATTLAAACDADRVEIWTDVCGVLSAPPRLVAGARTLPSLSFDEAAELAFFGAEVLHSRCLEPVVGSGIPVLIRNSLRPEAGFTVVEESVQGTAGARAVAAVAEVTVFEIESTAVGAENHSAPADIGGRGALVLASSRASAGGASTVVVRRKQADLAEAELVAQLGSTVTRRSEEAALLAIVGSQLLVQPWTVGRALEALGRRGVALGGLFTGAAGAAAVLVVQAKDLIAAVETVHEALMLGRRAEVEEVKNERADHFSGRIGRHRYGRPEARASLA